MQVSENVRVWTPLLDVIGAESADGVCCEIMLIRVAYGYIMSL
jgi:hypothetical protein